VISALVKEKERAENQHTQPCEVKGKDWSYLLQANECQGYIPEFFPGVFGESMALPAPGFQTSGLQN
jgi:hypothetical protein